MSASHQYALDSLLSLNYYRFQSSNMDQQYSTLELVRFDETARAPERDHDVVAAELDASALAPQVRESKSLFENCTK